MKKCTLLGLTLFSCLGYSNVVDSTIWKTSDVVQDFKTNYFCNKNLSKKDCNEDINNMKKYGIDINSLGNTNIKNIKLEKITYQTTNTFPSTGKITSDVSGLLILPETKSPKGVIVYYHPTIFDNAGVPSNFNEDNPTSKMLDTIYATIYATNGYIVVAPDYIGQGDDYKNYHPYMLYPKQTVNTAVDMLNSVSNEIRKNYNLESFDTLNLYSVGYSEGGSYSIWTAKCLGNKEGCQGVNKLDNLYNFRAAAGLSGAYDISNTTLNFITSNYAQKLKLYNNLTTAMAKPGLFSYTLMSYLHYGNTSKTISIDDINKDFFNMKCSILPQKNCNVGDKHYNLSSIFLQKHIPNKDFTTIFNSALFKTYPNNKKEVAHYATPPSNNSLYDLFNEKVFSDYELNQAMKDADIVNFGEKTKVPLYLFTLDEDSVVSPLNYDKFMQKANSLVSGFVLNNNEVITKSIPFIPVKIDINIIDHLTGPSYANLFAYKYIDNLNNQGVFINYDKSNNTKN
ncbi:MAG: hypothetical protein Kow0076_4700 [Francisella sp.]